MIEKGIRGDQPRPANARPIFSNSRNRSRLVRSNPSSCPRYSPEPVAQYSVASSDSGGSARAYLAGEPRSSPIWACGRELSCSRCASRSTARARLRPPVFATHPGARIAASEAALGGVRPNVAAAGGKSTFIAAARRAAQAAGQDPKSRQARPEPFKKNGNENGSLRIKVMTRVKSLFLAASIVAIIVGSIQFAGNIFDFGIFDTNDAKFANSARTGYGKRRHRLRYLRVRDIGHSRRRPARLLERAAGCASKCTGRCRCHLTLLVPPTLPSLTPAAPPPAASAVPTQPPLNLNPTGQGSPSLLSPPALNPSSLGTAPGPKGDVTGSIARAPADARPNRQPHRQPNRQAPRYCRPPSEGHGCATRQ